MDNGNVPNAKRLLWAGFMAILAAGVGFAIRGGIFDNWGSEFGFTGADLGAIGGAGFTGFCFGIIIGGVIADKIGYGKLVLAAFALHVLSAFVTFGAQVQVLEDGTKSVTSAYNCLYWGMFIFALANGTLEAVANPLVATIFPNNRTHYLNILHASWPAGLILGGVLGWVLDDKYEMDWKYQLALYLIPTLLYGIMFLGQKMPKSEASKQGLSLGEMFKDVGVLGGALVCFLLTQFFSGALGLDAGASYAVGGGLLFLMLLITHTHGLRGEALVPMGAVLLFVLFVTHALVGAVELGTDGWIQNITGNILTSEQAKILFVYTSALMFALRFCAEFIEKRLGLSPVTILFISAMLAFAGLNLVSGITTFVGALMALSIYGIGKTFFWPTMLAVASDRFPRTGAIAISIMGGIGMLSAGLIGSPGLGYCKDRFSGESLAETAPTVFENNKSDRVSKFLFLPPAVGINGKIAGDIQEKLKKARDILETGKVEEKQVDRSKLSADQIKALDADLTLKKTIAAKLEEAGVLKPGGNEDPAAALKALTTDEAAIYEAGVAGDRKTLQADSIIPATMAGIYLLLIIYFKTIGGYKVLSLTEASSGTDLGTAES